MRLSHPVSQLPSPTTSHTHTHTHAHSPLFRNKQTSALLCCVPSKTRGCASPHGPPVEQQDCHSTGPYALGHGTHCLHQTPLCWAHPGPHFPDCSPGPCHPPQRLTRPPPPALLLSSPSQHQPGAAWRRRIHPLHAVESAHAHAHLHSHSQHPLSQQEATDAAAAAALGKGKGKWKKG